MEYFLEYIPIAYLFNNYKIIYNINKIYSALKSKNKYKI